MHDRFLASTASTLSALTVTVAALHVLPRLGPSGRATSRWLCRAPGLDLLVTIFTVLPLFVGAARGGWQGLFGGAVGQIAALVGWSVAHELRHRRGARMFRVHNRLIGTFGNLSSLYVMLVAAPVFWQIRVSQYVVYPWLVRFARLPAYRDDEWVNVTRHKFAGLVGHDRVWCLYCDWMTGVWSLGTEMLRNLESFWCPIRFDDAAKCANCTLDFPDVTNGWAGERTDVTAAIGVLEEQYERVPQPASNAWFGHPVRLTIGQTRSTTQRSSTSNLSPD